MKVIVQRSLNAKVSVNNKVVGESNSGLVLLVGFTEGDNEEKLDFMVNKVLNLRIFDDEKGIMNKSILEMDNYSILSISQFTLYGDASKGSRPSYIKALKGEEAKNLYERFNEKLKERITVETGEFGSEMFVTFTNDGPVTIVLEK